MLRLLLPCSLIFSLCTCAPSPSEPRKSAKTALQDQFEGFWLGQCIANWTGLITEMDKIGEVGNIKTAAFYTRADWGGPDEPNIWSGDSISKISPIIDFVLVPPDSVWGADDDTDIEYMYQHLLAQHETPLLRPEQIAAGWMEHIHHEEENYLWVSNQRALDLMLSDTLPPLTGDPRYNEHYAMIDAQLTTEIFGLYAPGDPAKALEMAHLPIRTTAREEAAEIAEFNVVMYSLAAEEGDGAQVQRLGDEARKYLTNGRYPAAMYDFVRARYSAGIPWEQCRDAVYQHYQVDQADGYDISSQNIYCNGCFAAGINFAASIISLLYGEGDLKETIKIGTLCGWDSDNPTATWGGMLGFMMGRKAIEETFGQPLSSSFWIHRTRRNFPRQGMDNFARMAREGMKIREMVREQG
ncbi:ADP-ribosylglycohydrolase family protein [Neolewinella agarilytica]|uniref:ADP-ribosylglycohydrolase n=1 Tax=Neolewinella agarilytica TaxID=478744 RepID=A0A1H9GM35_9BACT|nr:ADP-ribosylglycohydrolase family protein [Neolewinella agarilytica]SEQ51109.1 ADP-ribosylglycohydrolase [Neolewinella agarilytica]